MTDAPQNTSLQAIYARIARIAVETNKPYFASQALVRTEINLSAAETDDTVRSNVVYLGRVVARRRHAQ